MDIVSEILRIKKQVYFLLRRSSSGGGGAVDSVNGQTGTVSLAVDNLTDVTAPTPSDNDVLTWDSGTSKWVNQAPTSGGVVSVTGSSVDNTDPTNPVINAEPTITTLPISKGGTNSGTALSNNRIMKSSGGAIVEAAAITASRIIQSDANGIPVNSNHSVSGDVITWAAFPITPSSAPTTNYQVSNKKYVDDQVAIVGRNVGAVMYEFYNN